MDLEKIGKGIMTSIEISELTCKLHKNVIADIRNEIQKLENAGIFTGLIFQPSEYQDSTGRTLPQYELSRDGVMMLAMKYDTVTREDLQN